jgi:hypothetical protein
MFLANLLFALLLGLLLTWLFTAMLGVRGPGGSFWLFFLILALAVWAGSLWIKPFGPPIFGVYWLPALFVGVLFALLIAVAIPPAPRRSAVPTQNEVAAAETLSIFFWFVVALLGLAILLALL